MRKSQSSNKLDIIEMKNSETIIITIIACLHSVAITPEQQTMFRNFDKNLNNHLWSNIFSLITIFHKK